MTSLKYTNHRIINKLSFKTGYFTRHLILPAFLFISLYHFSFAQSSDSLLRSKESDYSSLKEAHHSYDPYLRIGVPALMIGYGFTALENSHLKSLDISIRNNVTENHPDFSTSLDDYLIIMPAVAVYALNFSGVHGTNNFRDRTIVLGISLIAEKVIVTSLKHFSHQERPDGSDYLSFPSGHTTTAFATAEFLRQEYKDVSPWIGIAGYATATISGALRVYNNRHWFSNVVAGAGFGILSTEFAYAVLPVIQRKIFCHSKSDALLLPYYNSSGKGLTLVIYY
ncbi:MAG: phosphatase PAP2 family protein [Chitinophagales bacterium]|nr:phosphatase PAP2 family protein [Chitinophagales bacterium]